MRVIDLVPTDAAVRRRQIGEMSPRLLLATAGLVCLTSLVSLPPRWAWPSLLALGLGITIWALVRPGPTPLWARGLPLWLMRAVYLSGVLITTGIVFVRMTESVSNAVVALGLFVYLTTAAFGALSDKGWWPFLCVQVLALLIIVRSGDVVIDVRIFLEDSLHALLRGVNPYALTFENPYSARETALYYGTGVVVDDRIQFGFPYLPGVLLGDLPGYLLGDVRYSSVAALAVAAVLARRMAGDATGRLASLVLIASPVAVLTVEAFWVEPIITLALALIVWGLHAQHRNVAMLGLAWVFVSKQYLVVALPLVLIAIRRLGWLRTTMAGALGVAMLLPFVLDAPGATYRAIVEFHLRQPFREDSISLAVQLAEAIGHPPDVIFGIVPILVGLVTATFVTCRLNPGATSFALGWALSLLATVLVSKQAFENYFCAISSVLVFALCLFRPGVTTED